MSPESELVLLRHSVPMRAETSIEEWLSHFETEMRSTLHAIFADAQSEISSVEVLVDKLVYNIPSQISQLWLQWFKTSAIENALSRGVRILKSQAETTSALISDMVSSSFLHNKDNNVVTATVKSLICIMVYYRDCERQLAEQLPKVSENEHRGIWERYLRFYYDDSIANNNLYVHHGMGKLQYGWEYIGASPARLVYTPVSDAAFNAIWGAFQTRIGVCHVGQESVGKTELFHEFARCVGRFSYALDCNANVSTASMSRMLAGALKMNSFLVLKNIHKLSDLTFGVLMQCMDQVRKYLMDKAKISSAEDKDTYTPLHIGERAFKVTKDTIFGCFATLPVSNFQRKQLIGPLEDQMRLVLLKTPDLIVIAQVKLLRAGFTTAYTLGPKLGTLLRYASTNLSKEPHYHFGLVTLQKIVKLGESLLLTDIEVEKDALLSSIATILFPQLSYYDSVLFCELARRIFNQDLPTPNFEFVSENNAVLDPKAAELVEVFHNVEYAAAAVVGDPSCGKTTIIKQFAEAQNKLNIIHVNPVAIGSVQFLGSVNNGSDDSRSVLETLVSQLNQAATPSLLVIDGPLEASTMEALGPLIEGKRVTTLPNGKTLVREKSWKIIFEMEKMENLSWNIVTKLRFVLLNRSWNWRTAVKNWLAKKEFPKTWVAALRSYFSRFMKGYVDVITPFLDKEKIPLMVAINTLLKIIECRVNDANSDDAGDLNGHIEDHFVSSLMETVNCLLGSHRRSIESSFRAFLLRAQTNANIFAIADNSDAPSLFHFTFNNVNSKWELIRNLDLTHMGAWVDPAVMITLELFCRHQTNVFCMGRTGAGKSLSVERVLAKFNSANHVSFTLPIFQHTQPMNLVRYLDDKLSFDESTGVYEGPNKAKLTLFVDDLQLSQESTNCSPPVHEWLRFFLQNAAYWKDSHNLRRVQRVNIITASDFDDFNSQKAMSSRLQGLCATIVFSEDPLLETLVPSTCKGLLEYFLKENNIDNMQSKIHSLVESSLEIYQVVKMKLNITGFHIYSLRDLKSVFDRFILADRCNFHSLQTVAALWVHEWSRATVDFCQLEEEKAFVWELIQTVALKHYPAFPLNRASLFSHLTTYFDPKVEKGLKSQSTDGVRYQSIDRKNAVAAMTAFLHSTPTKREQLHHCAEHIAESVEYLCRLNRAVVQGSVSSNVIFVSDSETLIAKDLIRIMIAYEGFKSYDFVVHSEMELEQWQSMLRGCLIDCLSNSQLILNVMFDDGMESSIVNRILDDIHAIVDKGRVSHILAESEKPLKSNGNGDLLADKIQQNIKVILHTSPNNAVFFDILAQYSSLRSRFSFIRIKESSETTIYRWIKKLMDADSNSLHLNVEKICRAMVQMYVAVRQLSSRSTSKRKPFTLAQLEKLVIFFQQHSATKTKNAVATRGLLVQALDKITQAEEHFKSLFDNAFRDLDDLTDKLNCLKSKQTSIFDEMSKKKQEIANLDQKIADEMQDLAKTMKLNEEVTFKEGVGRALKVYEEAIAKVRDIRKEDIEEFKSFTLPPVGAVQVGEALCIMFDRPPTWHDTKKLVNGTPFLRSVIDFDIRSMNDVKLERLKRYIETSSFAYDRLVTTSLAAAGLCKWIRAVFHYCREMKLATSNVTLQAKNKKVFDDKMKLLEEPKAVLIQRTDELRSLTVEYEECGADIKNIKCLHKMKHEVMSEASTFNELNSDPVAEGQWIQSFVFEDVDFEKRGILSEYQAYQSALKARDTLRDCMKDDMKDVKSSLDAAMSINNDLTYEHIEELYHPKSKSPFEICAKSSLHALLKTRTSSSSSSTEIYKQVRGLFFSYCFFFFFFLTNFVILFLNSCNVFHSSPWILPLLIFCKPFWMTLASRFLHFMVRSLRLYYV